MALVGFFLPLTVINGVSIWGVYVPFVYLLSFFALQWRIFKSSSFSLNCPVALFGLFFSVLSAFYFDRLDFLNGFKIVSGLLLFAFLYSSAEHEPKLYSGFRLAILFCLIACFVQLIIFFIGGEELFYRLRIPVELWNAAGWYFMKDRDLLPAFPGLSYEPAYMAIFFSFGFVLAYIKKDKRFMAACCVGLILTFSRNGILFFSLFVLFGFLVHLFRSRVLLFAAFCFALFVIPFLLICYACMVGFDSLDVSAYSRVVPFLIFFEELSFLEMFVGASYQDVSFESSRYDEFLYLFPGSSENPFVDPRSFLGGMLFNSGFLGVILVIVLFYYLSRGMGNRFFLFFAPFILSSLNAYFVDWPVFWVFLFYLAKFQKIPCFGKCSPVLAGKAAINGQ